MKHLWRDHKSESVPMPLNTKRKWIWISLLALLGIGLVLLFPFAKIFLWDEDYDRMLSHLPLGKVQTIAPNELREIADNFIFLDTRSPEEYDVSHIKNARYIGYKDFSESSMDSLERDRPLIVYCSVGYRSDKIGQKLLEMGFEDVRNLYGGIFQWVNDGYPVFRSPGALTDTVHGYSWIWQRWVKKGLVVY